MPTTKPTESGDPVAEMKNGLIIADEAITLALSLEDRNHRLTVQDGALHVSDGKRLTAEDGAAIRRLRWHLMAIAEYQP